jgi:hypothetical protein
MKVSIVQNEFAYGGVGLWIYDDSREGRLGTIEVALPIELKYKEVDPNVVDPDLAHPTLTFGYLQSKGLLESLVQQLSSLGMKPESVQKQEGQIKAMQEHLNDMRMLVFNKEKLLDRMGINVIGKEGKGK